MSFKDFIIEKRYELIDKLKINLNVGLLIVLVYVLVFIIKAMAIPEGHSSLSGHFPKNLNALSKEVLVFLMISIFVVFIRSALLIQEAYKKELKSLLFFKIETLLSFYEIGFENYKSLYLKGNYKSFKTLVYSDHDLDFFNTVTVVFLGKKTPGILYEGLSKEEAPIYLFYNERFFELNLSLDVEEPKQILLFPIDKRNLDPYSIKKCVFIDKIAGNINGFADQEYIFSRYKKLVAKAEELRFQPIDENEMKNLSLEKLTGKMRIFDDEIYYDYFKAR